MRHHEKIGADASGVDFRFGHVVADNRHVRRNIARELVLACIDPGNPARNAGENTDQRTPHMPGAEQYDFKIARKDRFQKKERCVVGFT